MANRRLPPLQVTAPRSGPTSRRGPSHRNSTYNHTMASSNNHGHKSQRHIPDMVITACPAQFNFIIPSLPS
nr:hypothetical protein BaRGS_030774 [Batillaria attramentaria]